MKLQLSIDEFHRKAAIYMPETESMSEIHVNASSTEEEWEDAVDAVDVIDRDAHENMSEAFRKLE